MHPLTTALVETTEFSTAKYIHIPVAGLEADLAVPFQGPFHSEGGPVAGDEKREGDGEDSASGNLVDDCTVAVPNDRAKKQEECG